ncbi:MAG: hypothetical protein NTY46_10925 [Candidatus Sumerlaeota bacterium]|nr:hypothetical protein [Candidatus Sumerlaeota bacterium]
MENNRPTENKGAEKRVDRHTLFWAVISMIVILVAGFTAGVIDSAFTKHPNAFMTNLRDMLLVIASTAPWIVLFFCLCCVWIWAADRLFVRWNKSMNKPGDEAYGKGIIYEIVCDNNAAAALVLIMPTLTIALALIYIAILNKVAE